MKDKISFFHLRTTYQKPIICVVLRAAINNEKNKFREKIRERNTRFTWFDKLFTSTGERATVIIILIIGLQ